MFSKFDGFFSKNKIKFLVGFTIIESVVAVAIISFSVIGPLSAAKKGLSAASDSLEYSKTIFLADSASEFIRMIIDQNVLNDVDWLTDLDDCARTGVNQHCGFANNIYWDFFPRLATGIIRCEDFGDCELRNDPGALGVYSYKLVLGWDIKTGIKRKIHIDEIVDNKEVLVTVTVEKRRAGYPPRIFTSKTTIFNWKHQPHSI